MRSNIYTCMRKMKYAGFIIAIFLYAFTASAADVSFNASVDKDKVGRDDRIILTVTVSGMQNSPEPKLSKLDGFAIASRASSSQYNIINGRMSASKSYKYVLIPEKIGTFTIGAATLTYRGQEYKTDSIKVEVISGSTVKRASRVDKDVPKAKKVDLGDRVFIDVEVDKNEVYINEQITMKFKFYRYNLNIADLQYIPPTTKNFVEENLGQQRDFREVVNGMVYDVIELKTALFPVSSGELEISPAKLNCSVLVRTQRRRRGGDSIFGDIFGDSIFDDPFFDNYVKYPVQVESKPIKVTVKPLPQAGRPKGFNGAVGSYTMEVSLNTTKVKVGEPITITMKVLGEGNISGVNPPLIKGIENFKTYEPEGKVSQGVRGGTIVGEKVFEQVMVPRKEGKQLIPSVIFSYFDPRYSSYRAVSRGPFTIDVAPAPAGSVMHGFDTDMPIKAGKKKVRILKQDILFIKTSPGRVVRLGSTLVTNPLFIILNIIPLILFGGVYVTLRKQNRLKTDVRYARGKRAYKMAIKNLSSTHKIMKADNEKQYYSHLYKVLTNYIGDKLNIPSGGMTAQIVDEVLMKKNLDKDLCVKIKQFFEECDMGQFAASHRDVATMKKLASEVEALIKNCERVL
ncbi:MAG: BatD family protein [Candidatus Ancaeobacter aquaticus]|nr:BatD family protein [Candidatus Ancaeobacter aquaticus]